MSCYKLAGDVMVANRHLEMSADALPEEASAHTHIERINKGVRGDRLGFNGGGMQRLRTGRSVLVRLGHRRGSKT